MAQDIVNLSLRAALDLRYRRQELLTQNLVNADTRGYQPRDLEFEGVLDRALTESSQLRQSDAQHLSAGGPDAPALQNIVERPDVTDSLDGNGVDTDRELARIADNSAQFKAGLETLRRRYGLIKQTVTDMSRV